MKTMSEGLVKFQEAWKKVPEKCHGALLTPPLKTEGDVVSALAIAAITLRTLFFADILNLEEEKLIYNYMSDFYKSMLQTNQEREREPDDYGS